METTRLTSRRRMFFENTGFQKCHIRFGLVASAKSVCAR